MHLHSHPAQSQNMQNRNFSIREKQNNSRKIQEGIWNTKGIWTHPPLHIYGHVFHQLHYYKNSDFCSQADTP